MGTGAPLSLLLALLVVLGGVSAGFFSADSDGSRLPLPSETAADSEQKHFDGYAVLRAVPTNLEDLELLRNIASDETAKVDFWLEPTHENQPVDMMVPPELKTSLEDRLKEARIPFTSLIDDVERAVQEENEGAAPELSQFVFPGHTRVPYSTFFNNYQRASNMHAFMDQLASSNSAIASIFSIGRSTEGRDLKGIKIGSSGSNKPAIWIDGGIHAREWVSSASALYMANQLVHLYGQNAEIKSLVDTYDWYIVPLSNPDGYEYTHTNNRMWRKTRSRQGSCYGADPNRNFGYKWNTGGSSNSQCSDTFAGPIAFSEPETKAVERFVLANKNIKVFLTIHSYSQLWLTPWGWTSALPKDYSEMKAAADVAVGALSKPYGTRYRVGTSTNVLYIASGGSDDWAYGAAGIKYSYCLELRDTGRYGFLLPASQIIPTGHETFEGVKALAKYVATKL